MGDKRLADLTPEKQISEWMDELLDHGAARTFDCEMDEQWARSFVDRIGAAAFREAAEIAYANGDPATGDEIRTKAAKLEGE